MKNVRGASAVAAGAVLLWAGLALGQTKPADCPKAEKMEGKIVKIDTDQSKLTIQGADGKTFEFQASKETLSDKKVGDRLEITRRMPENCK
jgi:hypothetical protein